MKRDHELLLIELRHQLHQHPELSLEEHWTQEHLMRFLQEHTRLDEMPTPKFCSPSKKCVTVIKENARQEKNINFE